MEEISASACKKMWHKDIHWCGMVPPKCLRGNPTHLWLEQQKKIQGYTQGLLSLSLNQNQNTHKFLAEHGQLLTLFIILQSKL